MKKILYVSLVLVGLTGSPVFAALSPLSQSAKEIGMILQSNELNQQMNSGSKIQMIKRVRENSYLVLTDTQKVIVDVVYSSDQKMGAQDFTLKFRTPTSIDYSDEF